MWLERAENTELRTSIKDAASAWVGRSVALLTGDSRAFSLSHSWMVRHYLAEHRVRVIDCAVRYDTISIVDELLRLDLDVDAGIKAIEVRRAFTPYQILEAVADIPESGYRETDVYYLLAPYKQFFDGDVADDEAAYLLHLLNERLRKLSRDGWSVVVVEKSIYQHRAFSQAYMQLRSIATPVWGDYGFAPTSWSRFSSANSRSRRFQWDAQSHPTATKWNWLKLDSINFEEP